MAVTAGVLAIGGAGAHGSLGAYHAAMLVSAGFALVGVLIALRIKTPSEPRSDAVTGAGSGSGAGPVPAGRN